MTGQRKNKLAASYEDCQLSAKNPDTPHGGVRLFPVDVVPNPSTPSTSGSGDLDSAFVFPPPPPNINNYRRNKTKKKSELIVRTKSSESDLHDCTSPLSRSRPTFLSTSPAIESKSYRQKINFNDDSQSFSRLSLGSDDQTPDSPPPSFKPPTPTRTPTLSSRSKFKSDVERKSSENSPLPHSGASNSSPKPGSYRASDDKSSKVSGLVALTPFAAARLSLRKRKESKTTPPKEAEPDNFHNLHRKAQASLRLAVADKVSATGSSIALRSVYMACNNRWHYKEAVKVALIVIVTRNRSAVAFVF